MAVVFLLLTHSKKTDKINSKNNSEVNNNDVNKNDKEVRSSDDDWEYSILTIDISGFGKNPEDNTYGDYIKGAGLSISPKDGAQEKITILDNIPKEINGEPVVEISARSFMYANDLREVVIPGNIKYIGEYAFAYCDKLEKVTLQEGVEAIDSSVFFRDENLKEINFPASFNKLSSDLDLNFFKESEKKSDELGKSVVIYGLASSFAEEYAKRKVQIYCRIN